MRHHSTNPLIRSAAAFAAASTLAFLLAACAEEFRIDAGPAESDQSASESRTVEPALDILDAVTQHG